MKKLLEIPEQLFDDTNYKPSWLARHNAAITQLNQLDKEGFRSEEFYLEWWRWKGYKHTDLKGA